jgi:hypothetical protein
LVRTEGLDCFAEPVTRWLAMTINKMTINKKAPDAGAFFVG